ncbi:LAGLIDADG family homing endonuclease [Natronoglomus mannanivorans]|uniref:DNA polymerase II large subunit n=1 Tax=Natronoglomus mannanivorans TaxID=2979990 RepID=A0AAP3E2X8_9EURY|nr:type III effector protein [Halobacteria archaeon AArc-xg1-1]
MRDEDEQYFQRLENRLDEAFDVAEEAKRRGGDPEPEVEIPVARDMADRVENILGIDGVAERVRELEEQMSREEAALALAEDFAEGRVGDYETKAGKIEGAVRTAVALLTEGVVAAPIEGIDKVEILTNDDGTEFVNVYYAGPIRSAGGTAQALSVLVADYTRALVGIEQYVARSEEIERYAEEIGLYDKETGLQYSPKDKETKFIAKHLPIMLDGEATGDEEVSGFRDLERVDTNSARGGMCLVMAEGIALKAPKIQRYTRELDEIDWPWLQDLIDGTIGHDEGENEDEESADSGDDAETAAEDGEGDDGEAESDADDGPTGPVRVEESTKFLRDLIAGRPVFSHPCADGGFRLRYGRARNHGFATAGVHPATMHLVDDFLATGTQIKTERPGKAAGVVPVDSIEGPTVRLANGDVRRIDDPEEALEVRNGVEKILDLGEYLVNYGEFVENNHPLAPAGYVFEWWCQDMDAAGADVQAMADDPRLDLEFPTAEQALEWATEYDAPLHPTYTYQWHDLAVEDFCALADAVSEGRIEDGTLVLEWTERTRDALESIVVEHRQRESEGRLEIDDWIPFARTLGCTVPSSVDARVPARQAIGDGGTQTIDAEQDSDSNTDDAESATPLERTWSDDELSERARTWGDGEEDATGTNAIEAVNEVAPFAVRERAPTRIGNRMGRPEKSERRDLSPPVHTLFPIGEAGGAQRDVAKAGKHAETMSDTPGVVEVSIGRQRCPDCETETFENRCPDCNARTEPDYRCPDCETRIEPDDAGRVECGHCDREATCVERREIDINEQYRDALASVGERENAFDILKGVKGLMSSNEVPEPMEKGILRAKHDVSAFKDGTVRYDMTDLPVSAVRASELDISAGQLEALGYEEDIHGEPLVHDDQLVELKVQDIVLSDGAAEHVMQIADFIDDLLVQYYGLEPFYEVEDRQDLVGELVFGMAPHTSAATVGRVIGFTSAAVGYAHPFFHAAKRRNCFHPDSKLWIQDENDEWAHESIQTVVEQRLTDPSEDDIGTLVQDVDGLTVPSVTADGTPVERPVETVSKHPAPDHLVRVETRSGQTLKVTPDHTFRRWTPSGLEAIEARSLSTDDELPTPKSVDIEGTPKSIDLLEAFIETDGIPNKSLVVRGLGSNRIKTLLDDATPADTYLKPVAERLDLSQSTVYNWINRDSVPVEPLLSLFDTAELLKRVPDDVTLGVKRDTASVQRHFDIDESVATLLGYYAAEGFTRREDGSFYQTTICTPDESARDEIIGTFENALSIDAFEESEWKVTVSSRLVSTLFADVLNLGATAEAKRIPSYILDSPRSHLRAFLAAYFSGDGSTSSNRIEIRAHTISDELAIDLVAALKRFGIATKMYRETRRPSTGAVAEFYADDEPVPEFQSWVLKISSENAARFADRIGFHLERKQKTIDTVLETTELRTQRIFADGGDVWLDEVTSIEIVESDIDNTYCLTVDETNTLVVNDVFVGQCDGDEDCVMLLLDGLLNFSKSFLPDKRGGKMDAPLVMSSRIDPSEIDDEAHNMDVVSQYPREFYEATLEMADPGEVDVEIAEDTLGTDEEYTGFEHTHDTTDIAMGPDLSAYKTLGSMMDKMDAQLELSRKLLAVDQTDVAERVIEGHFLPDLIGNLRAFSRQETRCLDCGEKFRRMPLTETCRECGGRVNLTVHQGSVNKYMQTSINVAEEYGCREYTKQRLEVLEKSLESVFENDKNKQSGIEDFM